MKSDDEITNNFKKGKCIEKLVLREKDIKKRVNLLQYLAFYYANYVTGIYFSNFLERNLLMVSECIHFYDISNIKEKKNTVLHVFTIPSKVGGHTRVVNEWIEFDNTRKYSVLINEPRYTNMPIWLTENVIKSGGSVIFNNEIDIIEKAKFLALTAAKYEKVVLHIHNWDIIPVIAFGNNVWKKPIYLYNHSDHLFWVGISIADIVLDLTQEGMKNTISKRGSKKNYILPIPIADTNSSSCPQISQMEKSLLKQKIGVPTDCKVMLSMASDYKYTNIPYFNFTEFVTKIIHIRSDIYVLIIGANTKSSKWVELGKVSNGKIRAEGIISKEVVSEYMKIADIYLDSFPMNSYTCLLEAINYEIPSISLKTPIPDLDALKSIKFNTQDEMLSEIENLLNNNIDNTELKDKIRQIHYKENWNVTLDKIFSKNIKHTIELKKVDNNTINVTEYDKFVFEINHLYEGFPLMPFKKLSFKNKISVLLIFNIKLIRLLLNIFKNKFCSI